MSTINPMQGMAPISNHQPLRPVSCSLLTWADVSGKISARVPIQNSGPHSAAGVLKMIMSAKVVIISKIHTNRKNHQYSEREALPEKFP